MSQTLFAIFAQSCVESGSTSTVYGACERDGMAAQRSSVTNMPNMNRNKKSVGRRSFVFSCNGAKKTTIVSSVNVSIFYFL